MRLRSTARLFLMFAWSALVLVAAAAPAVAADTPAGEKSDGLAFLDLHRYDLGIFTLIVFGLLMLILWRFAWPKISASRTSRS